MVAIGLIDTLSSHAAYHEEYVQQEQSMCPKSRSTYIKEKSTRVGSVHVSNQNIPNSLPNILGGILSISLQDYYNKRTCVPIIFRTMSFGHYLIAKERGILREVQLNEVAFVNFSEESKNMCLATTNLNACSVVLVVSQSAALLAHIAPRPSNASSFDPDAGDHHVESMMNSFCKLYRENRHLFPINATWIGTGVWNEEVALPHQEAAIEGMLGAVGLCPSKFHYQIVSAPRSTPAGKGLVFIDGRPGRFGLAPPVYFEYMLIIGTRLPSPEGETLQGHTLVRAMRGAEDKVSGYRVQWNGQSIFVGDDDWQITRVLDLINVLVSPAFNIMILPEDW